MLFNSFSFLFFLFFTFIIYYLPIGLIKRNQLIILILSSFFFYAFQKPVLLFLLVFSVLIGLDQLSILFFSAMIILYHLYDLATVSSYFQKSYKLQVAVYSIMLLFMFVNSGSQGSFIYFQFWLRHETNRLDILSFFYSINRIQSFFNHLPVKKKCILLEWRARARILI